MMPLTVRLDPGASWWVAGFCDAWTCSHHVRRLVRLGVGAGDLCAVAGAVPLARLAVVPDR